MIELLKVILYWFWVPSTPLLAYWGWKKRHEIFSPKGITPKLWALRISVLLVMITAGVLHPQPIWRSLLILLTIPSWVIYGITALWALVRKRREKT